MTGQSLLMVEDDPVVAATLQEMLLSEEVHFDVTHVTTLKDALRQLSKTKFSLVMLDLTLPDSMGIETLRRMSGAMGSTPFIVLTGVDYHARKAIRAGAKAFLVKGSLTVVALGNAVRAAIQPPEQNKRRLESGA